MLNALWMIPFPSYTIRDRIQRLVQWTEGDARKVNWSRVQSHCQAHTGPQTYHKRGKATAWAFSPASDPRGPLSETLTATHAQPRPRSISLPSHVYQTLPHSLNPLTRMSAVLEGPTRTAARLPSRSFLDISASVCAGEEHRELWRNLLEACVPGWSIPTATRTGRSLFQTCSSFHEPRNRQLSACRCFLRLASWRVLSWQSRSGGTVRGPSSCFSPHVLGPRNWYVIRIKNK